MPIKIISSQVIEKARALMLERTKTNGAPAWGLTELAVAKGDELAQAYDVDASLVKVALYLAHIVFSKERNSETMNNHMVFSAREAEIKLLEWGVSVELVEEIKKAIELHHNPIDSGNIYYEVVKNAECFKFLTAEGVRIFMADLKARGLSESEIQEYVHYKIKQKYGYLTLDKAKLEAEVALPEIEKVLNSKI
jgi:glycerophosphoryl diester phosphodiesterase